MLSSPECRRLHDLHRRVDEYDRPPFTITSKGSRLTIEDRKELVDHVMSVGKKRVATVNAVLTVGFSFESKPHPPRLG
jgi:hypothetical protein